MASEAARRRFMETALPHIDDAFALARRLTGDPAGAEDVVQGACTQALRALDGPPASPRALLLAATRNRAVAWLAENRPHAAGAEEAKPEQALIEADPAGVEAAIGALPLVLKEALVMREINQLSYREIAEATGGRVGAVISRLARARALLVKTTGEEAAPRPDREDRLLMLHAALDGELDAAGAIETERALAADPRLAAECARLETLRRTIHAGAPRESAPAVLRARVMAAVQGSDAPLPATPLNTSRNGPSRRAFAAAIAAAVVLTAGLQMLIMTAGAPDEATQAIVAGHMRGQISNRPVDMASGDLHTVKPWLAGRLPVAAIVADLAPAGFELLGARIDIVAGAGAPTLVYKRHEHLVSLTELRFYPSDYPTAPSRRTLNGYPVVVWADGERAYAAVADLTAAELDAFVAAFRQAAAKETEEKAPEAK